MVQGLKISPWLLLLGHDMATSGVERGWEKGPTTLTALVTVPTLPFKNHESTYSHMHTGGGGGTAGSSLATSSQDH